MSDILAGLLAALVSTNTPTVVSNLVQEKTGVSIEVTNPNDPVTREYLNLVAADDEAVDQVEKWHDEANQLPATTAEAARAALNLRIRARLDEVKKNYEDFIAQHPDFVKARLAYGSFLNQTGDTDSAQAQWEKARDLDPKNPAAWDDLGNVYESSDVNKSFDCYSKAIELNPYQSVYYHNLAEAAYMYRREAAEHWNITDQQVYDLSLQLFRKAMALAPDDFILATDYANCFYGISPPRWKEGLEAWKDCLRLARDEDEREGILIHLARIELKLTNFDDSRRYLDGVTNPGYAVLRNTITRNLNRAIQTAMTNGAAGQVR